MADSNFYYNQPLTNIATEAQKKCINNFTHKPKKKKSKTNLRGNKVKFYCPIMKEGYWATEKRIHCPICYNWEKEDLHEPILFDEKKGHKW